MSAIKSKSINLIGLTLLLLIIGCGVKGDPQPPLEPPYIGRGEPMYDEAGIRELKPQDKKKKKGQSNGQ